MGRFKTKYFPTLLIGLFLVKAADSAYREYLYCFEAFSHKDHKCISVSAFLIDLEKKLMRWLIEIQVFEYYCFQFVFVLSP